MGVKPSTRPRGLVIDHEALRAARLRSGLSLAQVAGGDISRTHVHLLEHGRTRPSRHTLELIASRLGRDPRDFLAAGDWEDPLNPALVDPDLQALDGLHQANRHQDALALAEAARPRHLGKPTEPHLRMRIGRALAGLVRPAEALPHLESARAALAPRGDGPELVETLEWQGTALHQLEDPRALAVLGDTLALVRRLDPVPRLMESRILGHLAAVHLSRGEWATAETLYQEAVDAAQEVRDLARMAYVYDGMGLAAMEFGELGRAGTYFRRALALNEILRSPRAVARGNNNLGVLCLRQGRLEEAQEHLELSLAVCEDNDLQTGRVHVLISLVELHRTRGDLAHAQEYARRALEQAESTGETISRGKALRWLAILAEDVGDHEDADRNFEAALGAFAAASSAEHLIDCHERYAGTLERRGDFRGAAAQWRAALRVVRPASAVELPEDIAAAG